MTAKELEADKRFREAVRRLEKARDMPSQKARRTEREIAAELLKLTAAVARS